ncbi:MAG: recombination protein RecR [Phycisphaerales bacterium]|nr:MAG: recombination protein RecR [Phycisphaerales bacterium]
MRSGSGKPEPGRAGGRRGPGPGPTPYPQSVQRAIDELAALPGIGRRTAERLVFFLLKAPPEAALGLSRALAEMRTRATPCPICGNLADDPPCAICRAATPGPSGEPGQRDGSVVLVVEQPRDLFAIEASGAFGGVYHVLMGRLSPLENIGPGDLNIADLLARVDDPGRNAGGVPVAEVVLGLNPTLEGDATGLYLAQELGKRNVKVSRLARGLPSGGQIDWASKAVLEEAIHHRRGF